MRLRLTETTINRHAEQAALSGARFDLADAGHKGLWLRLSPGGAKSWVLVCRDRFGRVRRFPVGSYPTMGVSVARDVARTLHADVKGGADPIADARRDRAAGRDAKAGVGTLRAVLDIYESHQGKNLKSWAHGRLRVDRVFAALMDRPVASLSASDLQIEADRYPAQQSAAFAVRTIRPALKWAAHRKHLPIELAMIEMPVTVRRRDRVRGRAGLATLLPVLRASSKPHADLVRFLLMTAARLGEAAGARWRDVDWQAGTWTIPAERSKNGEAHTSPLPRQAIDLLTAIRPDAAKPDTLIFCTGTGLPLGNWDRETKALQAKSGTADWHRHDLRRTAATILGEMGEMPDIIEATLNHVAIRSRLEATYNRSRYRPQVAAALQRPADALDDIESGAGAEEPLRPVASG